ncbi:MAG: hypothetical protein HY726_15375 [Candidatus Rokubacteria bacterium]|nr:hypothetical protein [Candidatus Rokubacteria bacterium]
MDQMTQLRLMVLVALSASWALILGTGMGVSWLLDRRDRRRSGLRSTVLAQLASDDVRRRVGIKVRCGLLSRRGVVALDMSACSRNEIWETVSRLRHHLSPGVRVVVLGSLEGKFPAAFTLETTSAPPLGRAQPAPAPTC